MQHSGNGHPVTGAELHAAERLLDGAVDVLRRCANDPAEGISVQRAAELIPELQALGRSANDAHGSVNGGRGVR